MITHEKLTQLTELRIEFGKLREEMRVARLGGDVDAAMGRILDNLKQLDADWSTRIARGENG